MSSNDMWDDIYPDEIPPDAWWSDDPADWWKNVRLLGTLEKRYPDENLPYDQSGATGSGITVYDKYGRCIVAICLPYGVPLEAESLAATLTLSLSGLDADQCRACLLEEIAKIPRYDTMRAAHKEDQVLAARLGHPDMVLADGDNACNGFIAFTHESILDIVRYMEHRIVKISLS